jgi:hypothetical protein
MTNDVAVYTAQMIKEIIETNLECLLQPWMVGRSQNYVMDSTAKFVVATGYWLEQELSKICNDADRRTQCWKFNRMSRTYDVFEIASECMNEALNGLVEQNRKPHKRWG